MPSSAAPLRPPSPIFHLTCHFLLHILLSFLLSGRRRRRRRRNYFQWGVYGNSGVQNRLTAATHGGFTLDGGWNSHSSCWTPPQRCKLPLRQLVILQETSAMSVSSLLSPLYLFRSAAWRRPALKCFKSELINKINNVKRDTESCEVLGTVTQTRKSFAAWTRLAEVLLKRRSGVTWRVVMSWWCLVLLCTFLITVSLLESRSVVCGRLFSKRRPSASYFYNRFSLFFK